MQGYTLVPNKLFDTDELSYVTQSLGMWLCFLCQQSITGEHSTNLKALEGLVGHDLTDGDMYRLAHAGIITYEHNGNAWKVKLVQSL